MSRTLPLESETVAGRLADRAEWTARDDVFSSIHNVVYGGCTCMLIAMDRGSPCSNAVRLCRVNFMGE